ncbi:DUF4129 domain-containing protein [Frankia sp. AiPa1]|uniref:DUF4129 domain-containing protein n=1 Tax=Frankia sp. AiPa1 TaxID=573492 RepID=UPI00202BA1B2|nr:DUF4129 domain-containing protein [Frankia sp. AiPa1]MCL9760393.1 DUF4129 domain-containing protein [Frankia sp. AiPa1]
MSPRSPASLASPVSLASPASLGGPVTRDGARAEAHRELSREIYHRDGAHWWSRILGWIGDRVVDLWSWLFPHGGPGNSGAPGLGALFLVIAALIIMVALRWWLGPVRRTARHSRAASDDLSSPLTASRLRAEADQQAAAGQYALAVRSRLRAIVRMLEDRGVLDPRPGRTAGELVAEVARALGGRPAATGFDSTRTDPLAALTAAAEIFSETWYGGRPGTASEYQELVDADETLSRLRGGYQQRGDPPARPAVPA